jgi:hypothetical protein
VVADGGRISKPAFAKVLVADARETAIAPAGAPRPVTPEEDARRALGTLEDGPASGEAIATAFDSLAGRIDLYETYADVLQGSTSRLQPLMPFDPAGRAAWNERLFGPLTRRLIDDMKAVGLDLSRPEGLAIPLSPTHRNRLAAEFRAMARGFRSASLIRNRDRAPENSPIDAALLEGSDETKNIEIGHAGP